MAPLEEQNAIIGTPIKVSEFEIAQFDFPSRMTWKDAVEACANLGNGWRLPTLDELEIIYENKDKIGGFAELIPTKLAPPTGDGRPQKKIAGIKPHYWSSNEDYLDDEPYPENTWILNFDDGEQHLWANSSYFYVRAIRDLK